jgi:hypothetical protein
MARMNYVAVFASAVAAFVVGAVWYSPLLFGETWMKLRGMDPNSVTEVTISAGAMLAEFARWLVLAYILARFMVLLGIGDVVGALTFGGWMWLAIYTALAGSVLHEGTPWRLYAVHAGDGLAKIVLITTILGLWRSR